MLTIAKLKVELKKKKVPIRRYNKAELLKRKQLLGNTRVQLLNTSKALNITGRHKLNKPTLIDNIRIRQAIEERRIPPPLPPKPAKRIAPQLPPKPIRE